MKISDLHEALGWALLHFLWQGAAIAVVYVLMVLCVRSSARGRYASGILALAVMGIVFGITFARHVNAASASRDAAARLAAASSRPPSSLVLPDRPEPGSLMTATGPVSSAPVSLPLPSPQDREVAPRPIPQTIGAGQASTEPAKPAPIAAAADVPAWSRPLQSVLPWIVSAWGLGVILLLIRFALGWRSVRRMKASGEPPRDPLLLERFTALCERLRISRPVRLLVSPTIGVPALVGWLKPVVIIPAALLAGLTPAQTDAILSHELGHVRRHDFLINALQCLLEIVLFYHPAVWWISAHVRREREHCCDDIAAACCGSAADYARALAALEESRGAAAPALSMAASAGSLVGRIRRLVSRRETAPELPVWPLSLVAGALLLVVPLALLQAGEKELGQPEEIADAVEKPQPGLGTTTGQSMGDEVKLKLAIAAADGFFRADDAAGKMKFLRLDDAARTAAEAHFQKHGARAEDKARVILSRVQDDGSVVLAYDIGSRSHFFRATQQDGAMLLDWENSTLCQQGVYQDVLTEWPKMEPFRILAVSRTDDYYNHGFSDQKRWACHKLRFPGVEGEVFAYVDRATPEFKMLQERHQQGLSTTLAFTVRWPEDLSGAAKGTGSIQLQILKVEPVTGSVNQIGGKAAPSWHGQKEISTAGVHVLSPRITVKVTQDAEGDTLRNTLIVEGTDDAGNKITDHAALPYGVNTWGLLIEEPTTPDGSCMVTIGSRAGVQRFAFDSERARARGDKPGFDAEARWQATEKQFFTETLPQFANAAVVDWWENKLRHELRVETPRNVRGVEVRLVVQEGEVPEMTLPNAPLGASRLTTFLPLGPKLLAESDLEHGGATIVSVLRFVTNVRAESQARFQEICRQHGGRSVALLKDGTVIGTFELNEMRENVERHPDYRPGFETIVAAFDLSSTGIFGTRANAAGGTLSFKSAPAGSTAHAIAVQSPAGKPLPAFRVIAGVRSSVSSDFEKKHNCSVVNWQSHMLREGKDGKLEWPVSERSYDEMVLRIEADGYVPQVTGWLKKADRPQEITVQLAPDPGIRGSVQTHGGGRWAHDATVVLGMIRKDIRIKGATFPELDLGPEPKTLRDKWDRPLVITPDNEGRFTLPTEIDPTAVVLILHGDGVYLKPYAEWKAEPHVQLERWGRINGHVQWGPRVGKGEKVDLGISLGDDWGWPDIISQRDTETANEDGIFVFQRLLPNVTAQLSSPMTFKDDEGKEQTTYESSRITHVKTQPLAVSGMLGGVGRTVTGKLKGRATWDGVTFHLHPNAPPIGFGGDDVMWQAFTALQKSADGPLFFRSGLKIAADGSFKIEGMLPGHYQIFFTGPEGKDHIGGTQFQVPAEEFPGQELEPFHAGEIAVK